jgi:hypothetical protein
MDNESIVNRINSENEKKYGKIQPCCNMFKDYCRCEVMEPTSEWFERKLKEAASVPEPKSIWERLMFWRK